MPKSNAEVPKPLTVKQAGDWKPIETAPKDGTEVLACNGSWIFIAGYDRWGWVDSAAGESRSPVHWMPLPEPPEMRICITQKDVDLLPQGTPISRAFRELPTLEDLARSQNVQPMVNVRALFGTWPDIEDYMMIEDAKSINHRCDHCTNSAAASLSVRGDMCYWCVSCWEELMSKFDYEKWTDHEGWSDEPDYGIPAVTQESDERI